MSATGRGAVYRPLAAYYTSLPLAKFLLQLLPIWDHTPLRVLDPHVGGGSFLRAAVELEAERRTYHRLYGLDLDPAAEGVSFAASEGWGGVGDFLTYQLPARPDVVVGNPPFAIPKPPVPCPCVAKYAKLQTKGWEITSCKRCKGTGLIQPKPMPVAHLHIRRALQVVAPGGSVAFLLRMGIIETKDRLSLFSRTMPGGLPLRKVFALSSRPSFTGGGTDQAAYGFFWWQHGYTGEPGFEVVDNSGTS